MAIRKRMIQSESFDSSKDGPHLLLLTDQRTWLTCDPKTFEKVVLEEGKKETALHQQMKDILETETFVTAIFPHAATFLTNLNDPYIPPVQDPTLPSGRISIRHWSESVIIQSYNTNSPGVQSKITNFVAYHMVSDAITRSALDCAMGGTYCDSPWESRLAPDKDKLNEFKRVTSFKQVRKLAKHYTRAKRLVKKAKQSLHHITHAKRTIASTVKVEVPSVALAKLHSLIAPTKPPTKKHSTTTHQTIHLPGCFIKRDTKGKYGEPGELLVVADKKGEQSTVRAIITPTNMYICTCDGTTPWKAFQSTSTTLVDLCNRICTEGIASYLCAIGKMMGRCALCGKLLKDTTSKELGMDQECHAQKLPRGVLCLSPSATSSACQTQKLLS
jgi:hypothetical protein